MEKAIADNKEIEIVKQNETTKNTSINKTLPYSLDVCRQLQHIVEKSTLSKKLCELRNMINAGFLIIRMAQERKESRGLHYNIDYPQKKELV